MGSIVDRVSSELALYHIQDSPILLSSHQQGTYGPLDGETHCADLLNCINRDGEEVVEKKGRKKGPQVQVDHYSIQMPVNIWYAAAWLFSPGFSIHTTA